MEIHLKRWQGFWIDYHDVKVISARCSKSIFEFISGTRLLIVSGNYSIYRKKCKVIQKKWRDILYIAIYPKIQNLRSF